MNSETQSILAAAIVIATLAIFAYKMFAKKKGINSCGTSCACPGKSDIGSLPVTSRSKAKNR